MKKIEIYTTPSCQFCREAKNLLMAKNVVYTEINIANNPEKKAEMIKRTGGKTSVPEVFVDDKFIGDCQYIYQLEEQKKLDAILGV